MLALGEAALRGGGAVAARWRWRQAAAALTRGKLAYRLPQRTREGFAHSASKQEAAGGRQVVESFFAWLL